MAKLTQKPQPASCAHFNANNFLDSFHPYWSYLTRPTAIFFSFNVNPLQSVWSAQLSRRPTWEEKQSNGNIFKAPRKKNKTKTCQETTLKRDVCLSPEEFKTLLFSLMTLWGKIIPVTFWLKSSQGLIGPGSTARDTQAVLVCLKKQRDLCYIVFPAKFKPGDLSCFPSLH